MRLAADAMRHDRNRPDRGTSLLEALMAIAIFAVAFVMLLAVFPTAARAVRQGEEYLVATFLADRALEEVRGTDWDDLASSYTTVNVDSTQAGISQTTAFAVQSEVTEPTAGLKRVRVVVSWTRDRARHVEVLTDVTRLQ